MSDKLPTRTDHSDQHNGSGISESWWAGLSVRSGFGRADTKRSAGLRGEIPFQRPAAQESKMRKNGKQYVPKRAHKAADDDSHIWLGGEFYDPLSSASVPRETARKEFLHVASELYRVTADLRDNVFSFFKAAGSPEGEERFYDELNKWCSRYRLGQPWVLKQVFDTLMLWATAPKIAHLDKPNPHHAGLFRIQRRPSGRLLAQARRRAFTARAHSAG